MVINAAGLEKVFEEGGGRRVAALSGIDLSLGPGEVVILLGPSGSGKTTLLNLLSGLDVPSAGRVECDGRDLALLGDREKSLLRNRSIGFVFQFFNLLPEFTVLENVMLPALLGGWSSRQGAARSAAAGLLEELGLESCREAVPSELSGGEQQRVAVARALVNGPDFVFADEPTGNLDSANARACLDIFRRRSLEAGTAFVIATHNEEIARWPGARVLSLREGRLAG